MKAQRQTIPSYDFLFKQFPKEFIISSQQLINIIMDQLLMTGRIILKDFISRSYAELPVGWSYYSWFICLTSVSFSLFILKDQAMSWNVRQMIKRIYKRFHAVRRWATVNKFLWHSRTLVFIRNAILLSACCIFSFVKSKEINSAALMITTD